MSKFPPLILLGVLLPLVAAQAQPIQVPTLYNTGVDAFGNPVPTTPSATYTIR